MKAKPGLVCRSTAVVCTGFIRSWGMSFQNNLVSRPGVLSPALLHTNEADNDQGARLLWKEGKCIAR
jgi:hypothetical protein